MKNAAKPHYSYNTLSHELFKNVNSNKENEHFSDNFMVYGQVGLCILEFMSEVAKMSDKLLQMFDESRNT